MLKQSVLLAVASSLLTWLLSLVRLRGTSICKMVRLADYVLSWRLYREVTVLLMVKPMMTLIGLVCRTVQVLCILLLSTTSPLRLG